MGAPKGNKFAEAKALYKSEDALSAKIDEYFKHIEETEKVGTVPGLAWFLGYASKQSIYDLKGKYSYVIKRALLKLEDGRLCQGIPAVAVLDLKNNYNYTDMRQLNHSGTLSVLQAIEQADKDG